MTLNYHEIEMQMQLLFFAQKRGRCKIPPPTGKSALCCEIIVLLRARIITLTTQPMDRILQGKVKRIMKHETAFIYDNRTGNKEEMT
jgi:hypothetical protein